MFIHSLGLISKQGERRGYEKLCSIKSFLVEFDADEVTQYEGGSSMSLGMNAHLRLQETTSHYTTSNLQDPPGKTQSPHYLSSIYRVTKINFTYLEHIFQYWLNKGINES